MSSQLLLLLGCLSTTSATSTYSITSYYAEAARRGAPYFVDIQESSTCLPSSKDGDAPVLIECTTSYFGSVREHFGNSPYVLVLQYDSADCTGFSSGFGIPASDKCVGTTELLPHTSANIARLNADGSASIRWYSKGSCSEDSMTGKDIVDVEALRTHSCVNSRKWYSGKVARRLGSTDGSGDSVGTVDTPTTDSGSSSIPTSTTGSSSTDTGTGSSATGIDSTISSSNGSSSSTTGNGRTTPASTTKSPATSGNRATTSPSTTPTPTPTKTPTATSTSISNRVTSPPSSTTTPSTSGSTSSTATATPATNATSTSGSIQGSGSSLIAGSGSSGGTTDTAPTSSESSSSAVGIGVIAGIACGCIVVVLVIGAILFFICRRRDAGKHTDDSYMRPTTTAPSSGLTTTQGMVRGQTGLWDDDIITAKRISRSKVQVRNLLSRGGYGEVYAGVFHGRSVAVKMLLPASRTDIKHVNNFLAEAKMAATMDHPRIVSLVGIAWDSLSDLCVVFEFMEGGDLRSLLDKYLQSDHPVGLEHQKATIAIHVCHALTYLHSLLPSIIHRDLKSRNVLLNRGLEAKLTDFGVSRQRLDGTMTAGVGTSLWMAPEVMMGERYDDKADIFSLGVLLSELDVHSLPYAREKQTMSDAVLLHRIAMGTARVAFSPHSPREYQALGLACVSVDPRDRPTAAEALYRMQLVLANKTCQSNGRGNGRSHLEYSGSSESGSYTI